MARTRCRQRRAKTDELRHFLNIQTVPDYSALDLDAGTDAIRHAAADLDFPNKYQARLRLTGPVPQGDEEFATIKENASSTPL